MNDRFKLPIMATIIIMLGLALVGAGLSVSSNTKHTYNAVKVEGNGGHGSGVAIGNGYFVTANHVVNNEANSSTRDIFTIKWEDGITVKVKVVAIDKERDVAILYAQDGTPKKSDYATLYCKDVEVGTPVVAKGYPRNVGLVEARGFISTAPHNWALWKSVYNIDASVGPGMSGGPLYDALDGSLVGINVGMALFPVGQGASTFGVNQTVPTREICDVVISNNIELGYEVE